MAETPTFDFKFWAKDLSERALTTFGQSLLVFLPTLLAGHPDTDFWKTVAIAVIPAVLGVVLNGLLTLKPELLMIKSYYLDMFVRTLKTFLVSVIGTVLAAGPLDLFDASKWKVIILAGLVAAATVVKGALAQKFVKNTVTPASLLPKAA